MTDVRFTAPPTPEQRAAAEALLAAASPPIVGPILMIAHGGGKSPNPFVQRAIERAAADGLTLSGLPLPAPKGDER